MSPLNGRYCPKLLNEGNIYFCGDYANRPQQCINHNDGSVCCAIGSSVLDLKNEIGIKNRIENLKNFFENYYKFDLFD